MFGMGSNFTGFSEKQLLGIYFIESFTTMKLGLNVFSLHILTLKVWGFDCWPLVDKNSRLAFCNWEKWSRKKISNDKFVLEPRLYFYDKLIYVCHNDKQLFWQSNLQLLKPIHALFWCSCWQKMVARLWTAKNILTDFSSW